MTVPQKRAQRRPRRPEPRPDAAEVRRHADAHGVTSAAARYGVSRSTIRRWINPTLIDRSRAASRDAKRRRHGTCETCGAATSLRSSGVPARHCLAHSARPVWWTRERCVTAITRLARQLGRTPAIADLRDDRLLDALDGHLQYPAYSTVRARFGSYQGLLAAAGLPANPTGVRRRRAFPGDVRGAA